MKSKKRNHRGISLIEILTVVACVAMLALIIVPNFQEQRSRSRVSRAKADLLRLQAAAEAYAVDNSDYPVYSDPLNFDFLDPLARLSTPVAYLSNSFLPDAFGNLAYPDLGGNFVYFYFDLSIEGDLVELVANQILGYPPSVITTLGSYEYAFISVGPDRIAEFHRTQPPFGTGAGLEALNHQLDGFFSKSTEYDPTNGAISDGDISITTLGFLSDLP